LQRHRNNEAVDTRDAGFTLIEMLLVVVIIVTLAAMVVPRFTGRTEQARRSAAVADIHAHLGAALDLYELDNGDFPPTLEGLVTAPSPAPRRWRGPYLKKKTGMKDPWGNAYVYRRPGTHGDYDLYSKGPDGAEGTADDVTSWDDPEEKKP
jgi:general secretion pathway protein G